MPADATRVLQILALDPHQGASLVGSGYLLADRLVLTSRHVVAEAGRYAVRPATENAVRTEVARVEFHPDRDVALLVLDAPCGGPAAGGRPPQQLGLLPAEQIGSVQFHAVGLPAYAVEQRPARRQLTGVVPLASDRSGHHFQLYIDNAEPLPRADGTTPYQWFSGAAILADGLVIGVFHSHLLSEGPRNATAVDLASLGPTFERLLAEHGVEPAETVVRAEEDAETPLLAGIVTHRARVAGLGGWKSHLLPENLTFVSPSTGLGKRHESDPELLLRRLSAPDARGVLLVGEAGAGKSRTCLEVAARAHHATKDDGGPWRVLHVLPDSEVEPEALAQAVLARGPGRVLVVLDYLDVHTNLRPSRLADLLQPAARRAGVHVAFLASARPSTLGSLRRHGSHALFDEVTLRQDTAHQAAIVEQIMSQVASRTRREMGAEALRQACGTSPVFALLLAQDLERQPGQSKHRRISRLANGDLLEWLRLRLSEAQLVTEPTTTSPFVAPTPETSQLAAAAAVAACAQARDGVVTAIDALLRELHDTSIRPDSVVDELLRLGFLRLDGQAVHPRHDLLADELLHRSLLPTDGAGVSQPAAEALFRAALSGAVSWDRLTRHLRRLTADLAEHVPDSADHLERFCTAWMARHGPEVGALLRDTGRDGRTTLVTLAASRPWQAAVLPVWDSVVRPWLDAPASAPHVPRFLAEALQSCADAPPRALVGHALDWLGDGRVREADRVLAALLETAPSNDVADRALAWLARRRRTGDYSHLLWALLRAELPDRRNAVIREALVWRGLRTRPESHLVLPALLGKLTTRNRIAAEVVGHALAWLEKHIDLPEAGWVTQALFGSPHRLPTETRQAVALVIRWLDEHPDAKDVPFRTREVLECSDLEEDQRDTVAQAALDWLEHHSCQPSAGHPVVGLLRHENLPRPQARAAVEAALQWLRRHADLDAARYVLSALLYRPPRDFESEEPRWVIAWVKAWLERWPDHSASLSLSEDLLKCRWKTPQERHTAVDLALDRLARHLPQGSSDYGYAVRHLLNACVGLKDVALVKRAVDRARSWLAEQPRHAEVAPVLRSLSRLERQFQLPGRFTLVPRMVEWVRDHPEAVEARMLYPHLLQDGHLTTQQTREVVDLALRWLRRRGPVPEARKVASAVLRPSAVTAEQVRSLVGAALTRLASARTADDTQQALEVLRTVLDRPGYAADCCSRLVDWLTGHPAHPAEVTLLTLLLDVPAVQRVPHAEIDALALTRLQNAPLSAAHLSALAALLRRHLTGDQLVAAVGLAVLTLAAVLPEGPPPPRPAEDAADRDHAASAGRPPGPGREDGAASPAGAGGGPGPNRAAQADAPATRLLHALRLRQELVDDRAPTRWQAVAQWCASRRGDLPAERLRDVLAAVRDTVTPATPPPATPHPAAAGAPTPPPPYQAPLTTLLDWLVEHAEQPEADPLLKRAVRWRGLTPAQTAVLADCVHRAVCLRPQVVLMRKLLGMPHLPAEAVHHLTRQLLERHDTAPDDSTAPALHCLLDSRHAPEAADAALAWVGDNLHRGATVTALRALATRPEAAPGQQVRLLDAVETWLATNPPAAHAYRPLQALLRRRDLPAEVDRALTDRARDYLAREPSPPQAGGVLLALLDRAAPGSGAAAELVAQAVEWLTQQGDREHTTALRTHLAVRGDLTPAQWRLLYGEDSPGPEDSGRSGAALRTAP